MKNRRDGAISLLASTSGGGNASKIKLRIRRSTSTTGSKQKETAGCLAEHSRRLRREMEDHMGASSDASIADSDSAVHFNDLTIHQAPAWYHYYVSDQPWPVYTVEQQPVSFRCDCPRYVGVGSCAHAATLRAVWDYAQLSAAPPDRLAFWRELEAVWLPGLIQVCAKTLGWEFGGRIYVEDQWRDIWTPA